MDMIGTGHETRVNGTTIAWGEMGSGDPLVLIHGLMDSHRTWRRVAPVLAERFRVLMPDLPGHGLSGRPEAPYTLEWHAATLSEWMGAIGVDRAHVCGHSLGGGIAQWMVLDHRPRVDRLALVAAGGLGREVAFGLRLLTVPGLGRNLTPWVLRLMPSAMRLLPWAFGNAEPDEIERVAQANRLSGTLESFQTCLTAVVGPGGQTVQSLDRIEEVESLPPIALFWGRWDPMIPVRHGRKAHERLKGSTLDVLSGCGHVPQLEAPAALIHALKAFLSDPDRPATRWIGE